MAVQGRAKAYVRGARHYGGLGGAGGGRLWGVEDADRGFACDGGLDEVGSGSHETLMVQWF